MMILGFCLAWRNTKCEQFINFSRNRWVSKVIYYIIRNDITYIRDFQKLVNISMPDAVKSSENICKLGCGFTSDTRNP